MGSYSFGLNCGKAFEWDDPALSDIKGLFAKKKQQARRDEMYGSAEKILQGNEHVKSVKKRGLGGGFVLQVEAKDLDEARAAVGGVAEQLQIWYNGTFNQSQEFTYGESRF